jgi:hypothetical protein
MYKVLCVIFCGLFSFYPRFVGMKLIFPFLVEVFYTGTFLRYSSSVYLHNWFQCVTAENVVVLLLRGLFKSIVSYFFQSAPISSQQASTRSRMWVAIAPAGKSKPQWSSIAYLTHKVNSEGGRGRTSWFAFPGCDNQNLNNWLCTLMQRYNFHASKPQIVLPVTWVAFLYPLKSVYAWHNHL